jgi:hypothetical protein
LHVNQSWGCQIKAQRRRIDRRIDHRLQRTTTIAACAWTERTHKP